MKRKEQQGYRWKKGGSSDGRVDGREGVRPSEEGCKVGRQQGRDGRGSMAADEARVEEGARGGGSSEDRRRSGVDVKSVKREMGRRRASCSEGP
jgi:hypothetical protein